MAVLALLVVFLISGVAVGAYVLAETTTTPSPKASPNKTEVSVRKGEELRVTFVGDSLTYGLFATEPSRGFRQLMLQTWRADGAVVDNPLNSLAGGTTADALGNPDFPHGQHLYVVQLGTNDAVNIGHPAFRQNYDELLERIRASSPDAALLCVGLWRPKDVASRFDTIIKDLCEVKGGHFRGLSDLAESEQLKGPADLPTFEGPSDTFHPNDSGHSAIARRLIDALVVNRAD